MTGPHGTEIEATSGGGQRERGVDCQGPKVVLTLHPGGGCGEVARLFIPIPLMPYWAIALPLVASASEPRVDTRATDEIRASVGLLRTRLLADLKRERRCRRRGRTSGLLTRMQRVI